MTDIMEQRWCCLACRAKLRFGEIIGADTLRCPKCDSDQLCPADGSILIAEEAVSLPPGEFLQ